MSIPESSVRRRTLAHRLARTVALAVVIGAIGCDPENLTAPDASDPAARPTTDAAASPTIPVAVPAYQPRCVVIGTASVEEGVAPLEVVFNAEGMCSRGPATFLWDFGDGSPPADGAAATHLYDGAGTYVARVTITDTRSGTQDADEAPITVTAQ
jgi:PKD repeat protein